MGTASSGISKGSETEWPRQAEYREAGLIFRLTSEWNDRLQLSVLGILSLCALYRAQTIYPLGLDGYLLFLPGAAFVPLVVMQLLLATRNRTKSSLALSVVALLIFIGPLLGLRWGASKGDGGDALTLVSLNVNSWHSDLDKMAQRIQEEEPDFIALQEVWAAKHLLVFEKAFPEYLFVGPTGGINFGGGNFLGVRTTKGLSVVSQEATYEAAGMTIVRGGQRLLVLSVHSPRSHDFAPRGLRETIREQTEQTLAIFHLVEQVGQPSLVVGDFNSLPVGPSQKLLRQRFQSAFESVGRGFGYTFPSKLPLARIDSAWGTPDVLFQEARTRDFGSDHLGLVVKFSSRP